MCNFATLLTILTTISVVLCAPGPYHPYHRKPQPGQTSSFNSTLSTSSSMNIHYRHLRFGHRRYHAGTYRPHAPTSTQFDTIPNTSTSGSLPEGDRHPTRRQNLNTAPTPAPTGAGSEEKTVHINDEGDFALILPKTPNEKISDAEADGVAFCSQSSSGCSNTMPAGFITASSVTSAPATPDGGSAWIQVTGCIDPSKMSMSPDDDGGQFDVRYPNGAQCTFGGYGASFIEQVEPSAKRFCLRCCSNPNDQINCNSHQDRSGCLTTIPGTYDFPEKGVSCA